MFVITINPPIFTANINRLSTWIIGTIESATYSSVIKKPHNADTYAAIASFDGSLGRRAPRFDRACCERHFVLE